MHLLRTPLRHDYKSVLTAFNESLFLELSVQIVKFREGRLHGKAGELPLDCRGIFMCIIYKLYLFFYFVLSIYYFSILAYNS